jgi:hypothetical protein
MLACALRRNHAEGSRPVLLSYGVQKEEANACGHYGRVSLECTWSFPGEVSGLFLDGERMFMDQPEMA